MALAQRSSQKSAMTAPNAEPLEPLTSVDTIKAFLAGLVVSAINVKGPKVQLTVIGGEFAKITGAPFEKHLNTLAEQGLIAVPKPKRKLATFVESYCQELIGMERSATGTWLVFPLERAGEQPTITTAPSLSSSLRFKPAVWAAFIRPIAAAHRFLNLEQIGFTDSDEQPAGGTWREIDRELVVGAELGAPVDGEEVQARIERWAASASVPLSALTVAPTRVRDLSRPLEQLLDIIDGLPMPLLASWSIPAAVLKHLRQAR